MGGNLIPLMKTTPFPRGQVIKPIRTGSYIVVSKMPLPRLSLKKFKKLTKAPTWLKALARRLNQAVSKLNKGILEANRQYARNKSTAAALATVRSALGDLDRDLHGVHWPSVRPPFSNRKPGANTVESARFPLKPQDGAKFGGYVTFHCDLIEDSQLHQLVSWGLCVNVSIVYYSDQGSESSDFSTDSSLSSEISEDIISLICIPSHGS
jgi:hypothetical protein